MYSVSDRLYWNSLPTAQISHQRIFIPSYSLKSNWHYSKQSHHFRIDIEVQEAIVKWFHDLDPQFFYIGSDRLVFRWKKCFENHND